MSKKYFFKKIMYFYLYGRYVSLGGTGLAANVRMKPLLCWCLRAGLFVIGIKTKLYPLGRTTKDQTQSSNCGTTFVMFFDMTPFLQNSMAPRIQGLAFAN